MRRPSFKRSPGDPPPLRATVERTVRFEEIDHLGIVWHGRYPSYFEDARVALGDRYGIGYRDFIARHSPAPVKSLQIDYLKPLRFGERFRIEAILHWSEAARLDFEFVITNAAGEVATTGWSIQVFTDESGELLLVPPPLVEEFREKWRQGLFP